RNAIEMVENLEWTDIDVGRASLDGYVAAEAGKPAVWCKVDGPAGRGGQDLLCARCRSRTQVGARGRGCRTEHGPCTDCQPRVLFETRNRHWPSTVTPELSLLGAQQSVAESGGPTKRKVPRSLRFRIRLGAACRQSATVS